MSEYALRLDKISKMYRLGGRQYRNNTLRDALSDGLRAPFTVLQSRFQSHGNSDSTQQRADDAANAFWALRDVTFDVKQGEVVGIIGRNGAGKSTLLKVLSRITEPTRGHAELRGRVGALLEVGTGFHPELTGRENIYLNGAILGMRRTEIERKFDEIVAFSEVEQFLDTPVKRYSSGMYVRLAFAVAANLEPDILVVDEVLAVGDAEFQRKCLGKMEEVTLVGRTVLFVSHNMAAIQRLCHSAVWLDHGQVRALGPAPEVTARYLSSGRLEDLAWEAEDTAGKDVFIKSIQLTNHAGEPITQVTSATDLAAVIGFSIRKRHRDLQFTVGLIGPAEESIFDSSPQDYGATLPTEEGEYQAIVRFPTGILMPTTYTLKVGFWTLTTGVLDVVGAPRFLVEEVQSAANARPGGRAGVLFLPCEWSVERV